nr:putative membrane-bound O-acyltransferase C24H6.01C isoform X1 [Ipomoea batatas]
MTSYWRRKELPFLILYAVAFYAIIIRRAVQLSRDHYNQLHGMRRGWIVHRLNDASDAQWRNFRGNLPILTLVFGIFTLLATVFRTYGLKAKGMSVHHMAFHILSLFSISPWSLICGRTKYAFMLWIYNLAFLVCNRVYDGYPFSSFG